MASLKVSFSSNISDGLGIDLTQNVLTHVGRYRQTAFWKREAGGQLFGRLTLGRWVIEASTGPRRTDIRSRFGFLGDRTADQTEINAFFSK